MLRKGVFFCESFIPRADAFTKTGKASKVLGNGIVESGLKHLDNVADGIKKLVKKADDAIDLEKHLPKKLLKEEAEAFAKKADKVADDVVEDAAKAIKSGSNTVNPKDVNFMQSSIKNQTGEHTVLGNAEALKSGALKATDLPEIRIWQDADGKLWTLDHRRLAAFRMAELDSVPFRWATDEEVANQMWKMTTKTNGISIKLKLADGQSMTIQ